MKEINLLPKDIKPKESTLRFLHRLKSLNIVVFVLLVIVVSVNVSVSYLYENKIKESTSIQNGLKRDIKTLEETEKKIVLIKDRLNKLSLVENHHFAQNTYYDFQGISRIFKNAQAHISNYNFEKDGVNIQVNCFSYRCINQLLAEISVNGVFKNVQIASFSFSKKNGFSITVMLNY